MITYSIESQFPGEDCWHTVWITPGDRTTIRELNATLALYRSRHPDVQYRLVKIEVIG